MNVISLRRLKFQDLPRPPSFKKSSIVSHNEKGLKSAFGNSKPYEFAPFSSTFQRGQFVRKCPELYPSEGQNPHSCIYTYTKLNTFPSRKIWRLITFNFFLLVEKNYMMYNMV